MGQFEQNFANKPGGISCFLLKLGRIGSELYLLFKNLLKLTLEPKAKIWPFADHFCISWKICHIQSILGNYPWFHLIHSIIEGKYSFAVFPRNRTGRFDIGIINLFLKKCSTLCWAVWLNSLNGPISTNFANKLRGVSCFLQTLGRIGSELYLLFKNLLKLTLEPKAKIWLFADHFCISWKICHLQSILGNYPWFHLIHSII